MCSCSSNPEFFISQKTIFVIRDIFFTGPIKVNLEFIFSFAGGSFFGSEHEHLFGFQTLDSIHISISVLTEKKVQNLACRKPKANNQKLLRNKLKLKYEVNLRFKSQI